MHHPARNRCGRRPGQISGLLLALVFTLAPQVSVAAVELACEVESVEINVAGSPCRSVRPDRSSAPGSRGAARETVSRGAAAVSVRRASASPGDHTLPNGQRAPLIC